VAALVIAQWFIVPGFVAFNVPSHSDLWRYYVVAHEQTLRVALTSPRPLMLIALQMLGQIDSPRILFALLNVPALLFVVSAIGAVEHLGEAKVSHGTAFALFVLLFGTSTFYELNPLDYGGMLAGVFLAAQIAWLSNERHRAAEDRSRQLWIVALVAGLLTYLSLETKPTFAALLPLTPLLLYRYYTRKRIALCCAVCAAFIVLSVVKDIQLNSPFMRIGSSEVSPYQVGHDPVVFFGAAVFYVSRILPWQLLPLAMLSLIYAWRRDRSIAVAALVAPVLTVLPMCAIPTRLLPMYSWFGMAIMGALLAGHTQWHGLRPGRRAALVIFFLFGLVAEVTHRLPGMNVTAWVITNHRFNINNMRAAEALATRVLPGERLLIAGPLMPFSPFKNDRYIALTTPVSFTWAVAYPKAEEALAKMFNDSHVQIAQDEIDFARFDRVALFDADGNLARLATASEFSAISREQVAAQFYCSAAMGITDPKLRAIKTKDCLVGVGELAAAEGIGKDSSEGSGR
jgi:hypothetical protein